MKVQSRPVWFDFFVLVIAAFNIYYHMSQVVVAEYYDA